VNAGACSPVTEKTSHGQDHDLPVVRQRRRDSSALASDGTGQMPLGTMQLAWHLA
jgi:hypothetical protein